MSAHSGTAGNGPSCGDIVIVGAGLAGLFTALKLAPLAVTVIAAAPLGEGASSAWAQGGIAAAVGEGDSPAAHLADTLAAGAGIVDKTIARLTTNEAPARIRDLLHFGVPFDRDLAGHFVLSREAAHSAKRIVRVAGDGAGKAIMQALIASVRQTASIRVLEGFEAFELSRDGAGRINGVMLTRTFASGPVATGGDGPAVGRGGRAGRTDQAGNATKPPQGAIQAGGAGECFHLAASAIVLATGGVGHLFALTTNPAHASGDAIAMAARAGAVIADAEFVQFHPTAIDVGLDPAPLATEALRGEGATLINRTGERFMAAQHEDGELGPRDIVARAVFREIKAGRGAFLDCRKAVGARFARSFPTVYQRCIDAGIDPVRDPIPVAPAQHYHMGGIHTDANGRTSIAGLWACGEVTSTGLHGANRLASNSLLEAVVFGARVAADIASSMKDIVQRPAELIQSAQGATAFAAATAASTSAGQDHQVAVRKLRQTMQETVGVERNACGLQRALATITDLEAASGGRDIKLANMTLAARFIATAALAREESRGGHYRSDFPERKSDFAKRSFLTLADLDAVPAATGPAATATTTTAATATTAAGTSATGGPPGGGSRR